MSARQFNRFKIHHHFYIVIDKKTRRVDFMGKAPAPSARTECLEASNTYMKSNVDLNPKRQALNTNLTP